MAMIQWFPGHMNKAKRAIQELLSEIDIVIELLDARAPFSSCNPLLQYMIKGKNKIRILNKSDISDDKITTSWLEFFSEQENTIALLGDMNDGKQAKRIINLCRDIAPSRNSFEKPLRIMITGIPNVGKSTLINQLMGKKVAKTGDIPAVTKANQRIIYDDNTIIYDTPGMMWQKIKYPQIGYHLAICNSIGRNALDEELLVLYLVEYLSRLYPHELVNRYNLKHLDLNLTPDQLLNLLATKRGAIMPGGIVDKQKISEILITDFRNGRIGLISLETPNMWKKWIKEFRIEEKRIAEEEAQKEADKLASKGSSNE